MLLGILSRKRLKVKSPMYTECQVEDMNKRPSRVKGEIKIAKLREFKVLEECASIDQIESRTPVFMGLLREFITKKRYTCATIFVDHFSGFTYIHL